MNKRSIALLMCALIGFSIGASEETKAELNNGWININNIWKYYESDENKLGWLSYGGNYYYLNNDGRMVTGWLNLDNSWYYMNESGAMTTGWQKDKKDWYFMDQSGKMKTGWLKDKGNWYYLREDGAMACNSFIDRYYLGPDGAMIERESGNEPQNGSIIKKEVTMKTEKRRI